MFGMASRNSQFFVFNQLRYFAKYRIVFLGLAQREIFASVQRILIFLTSIRGLVSLVQIVLVGFDLVQTDSILQVFWSVCLGTGFVGLLRVQLKLQVLVKGDGKWFVECSPLKKHLLLTQHVAVIYQYILLFKDLGFTNKHPIQYDYYHGYADNLSAFIIILLLLIRIFVLFLTKRKLQMAHISSIQGSFEENASIGLTFFQNPVFFYSKSLVLQMDTKVITLTMFKEYPYSVCKEYSSLQTTVQVKRCLDFTSEPRIVMKQKIRLLKNISERHLVELLSTQQEQNKLNLFFEYVPKRLDSVLWTLKLSAVQEIQRDLLQLAQSLAYHSIMHQFRVENVGLDRNNELKYFLGFAFQIDRTHNNEQTANRYFCQIGSFFAEGGKLCRVQHPAKSSKIQYSQTMDSTSCKTTNNFAEPQKLEPPKAQSKFGMKKSATVCDNLDEQLKKEINSGIIKRFSLNVFTKDMGEDSKLKDTKLNGQQEQKQPKENLASHNERQVLTKIQSNQLASSKPNYTTETTSQLKMFKVEELGARINKLKHYMKGVTGKTPTNGAGLSHLMVHIDGNNADNRIFQENKLMITPNYTKMQKKIAEFRESKLYRAYGEREILYNKNNQAYQLHTTQQIQNNTTSFNNSQSSKAIDSCSEEAASSPKHSQLTVLPSYMLRKQNEVQTKSSRTSPDQYKNTHQVIQKVEDPKVKEYRKMAKSDKYCEEFMYFLEDEAVQIQNQKASIDSLINRMLTQQSRQRGQDEKSNNKQREEASVEIQNRVKKAIRNSLKLINGLKYRDSQLPQ